MCLIDRTRALLALGVVLGAVGCAAGEPYSMGGTGGTAGAGTGGAATGSGGATTISSGGAPGSGGATTSSGGAVGSGGATTSGGASGSGGAKSGSGGSSTTPGRLPLPWMDDFEADSVGGIATGWLKSPKDTTGVWAVAMDGGSKVFQQSASADQAMVIGGDVAWTDQKVETRVKIPTANSSVVIMLISRFTDLEAYYYLQFNGEGQVKIRKRFGGSTTDLVTYKSNMPLVAGTWYTVGFGFKGSTVTAYLNGAMVGTMTESAASNAAGGIGLGVQNGAATFDDVKVTLP